MNVTDAVPSRLTFDMIKDMMPPPRPYEALFVNRETLNDLKNQSDKRFEAEMPMSDQISTCLGVNIIVKEGQKTPAFMMQDEELAKKYINNEISEQELIEIIQSWKSKT